MEELWTWLETRPLTEHIAITWWFPLIESIHVVTLAFIIGTILTVDLRLVGVSALRYPASRIVGEHIRWTWAAFLLTLPTGFAMFATRAGHYAGNPAFRWKLVFLALAGLNMWIFHLRAMRSVAEWDTTTPPPIRARLAGICSLVFWSGVVFAGRWTGHLN